MRRIRLAVCAVVFTVAAAGLAAGCGGDEGSDQPSGLPSKIPSEVPSDLPSGAPSGTISAKPGKLPKGFPLPKGAEKGDFTEAGGTVTGTVTVTDGSKAYDFWVDELPKDGYEVSSKNKVEVSGTKGLITFSGKGYRSATITITDSNAAISLQK